MAVYTTQVRTICEVNASLNESVGASKVDDIIALALPKIFNFDFPIFDEAYRKVLEHKIIKHYYTREIGAETVGLWQLWLNTKLNEIMPYYNKLYESELLEFNPMYTHNLKRKGDREGTTLDEGTEKTNGTTTGTVKGTTSGNDTSWNMRSDTPQGSIDDLDKGKYLTEATKYTDSNNTTNNSDTSSTVNENLSKSNDRFTTEDYTEDIVGYEGVSGSKLLKEFRSTFLNIDMLVINELEVLFMQLW